MVQGQQNDLYAVAGGASEIRIYTISPNARQGRCLEKVTTLTTHNKEVVAVAIDGLFVATLGLDQKLIIHKLDPKQSWSKVVSEATVNVQKESKIAFSYSDQSEKAIVAITTDFDTLKIYDLKLNLKKEIHSTHDE